MMPISRSTPSPEPQSSSTDLSEELFSRPLDQVPRTQQATFSAKYSETFRFPATRQSTSQSQFKLDTQLSQSERHPPDQSNTEVARSYMEERESRILSARENSYMSYDIGASPRNSRVPWRLGSSGSDSGFTEMSDGAFVEHAENLEQEGPGESEGIWVTTTHVRNDSDAENEESDEEVDLSYEANFSIEDREPNDCHSQFRFFLYLEASFVSHINIWIEKQLKSGLIPIEGSQNLFAQLDRLPVASIAKWEAAIENDKNKKEGILRALHRIIIELLQLIPETNREVARPSLFTNEDMFNRLLQSGYGEGHSELWDQLQRDLYQLPPRLPESGPGHMSQEEVDAEHFAIRFPVDRQTMKIRARLAEYRRPSTIRHASVLDPAQLKYSNWLGNNGDFTEYPDRPVKRNKHAHQHKHSTESLDTL